MTYFNKNKELKRGYNAYIDESTNYMGTLMNVGLLVMEDGDTYTYESADREVAILLFEGKVTYEYAGKTVEADRPNCFHHEAYCLLAPKGTKITLTAHSHSELYMQDTLNEKDYEPVMYTPETVQTQHAGSKGELMGAMEREIKTFFDYDNAPFSNMVLGEVLNRPGKWSSYPPHHHPRRSISTVSTILTASAPVLPTAMFTRPSRTAAPSSTTASTLRWWLPATPCATPGVSGIWRAIPG